MIISNKNCCFKIEINAKEYSSYTRVCTVRNPYIKCVRIFIYYTSCITDEHEMAKMFGPSAVLIVHSIRIRTPHRPVSARSRTRYRRKPKVKRRRGRSEPTRTVRVRRRHCRVSQYVLEPKRPSKSDHSRPRVVAYSFSPAFHGTG